MTARFSSKNRGGTGNLAELEAAVDSEEHQRIAKLESDRARLIETLESLTDSHEALEKERGSMRATHTANARSLLRELEGKTT